MVTCLFSILFLLFNTSLLCMDPTSPRLLRDTNHAIAPEERRRMEEPLTTDAQGNTPLHLAIMNKNSDSMVVKELIDAKADVNAQNNEGDTPLHLAFMQKIGAQDITGDEEELENRQKIIYLLEAGARINIKNKQGELRFSHTNRLLMWYIYIPLAVAIQAQDNDTVCNLLVQGADPNHNIYTIPNNRDKADYLLSVALHSRNELAVRMLLDAGADPVKHGAYESNDPGPMRVIKIGPEAICQKAIKSGHITMAQLLITHVPRPLMVKHLHLNNMCKTVLLCCRRVNSSLPQDVRKLLCYYCVKSPIIEEQEKCTALVCSQVDFGSVTYPNNIQRSIEDANKFDNKELAQYHPIWAQQIYAFVLQGDTKKIL